MASSSSPRPVSNLAVAIAKHTPSLNIPKSRDAGRPGSNLAPNTKGDVMLLTPPHSLSPTLPPHKVHSASGRTPATQADSDLDLQDAVEHAASVGQPQALSSAALSGLESAGAITPTMLARDHLPEFLLASGPLAIRHILGHLTQTVPGFSRIPPAKARRIVVAALESRGGGGQDGDVLFEKVGWGRWDARIRGQPPREGQVPSSGMHELAASPPSSVPGSYAFSNTSALQIPNDGHRGSRPDLHSGGSWTGESFLSGRDEDMMDMAEHEADKMSLDEREDIAESSHGEDDSPISDKPGDTTDEEDWAAIGAKALRERAAPHTGSRVDYNHRSYSTSRTKPFSSGLMQPVPGQKQRRASSTSVRSNLHHSGVRYPGGIVPPGYYSSAFLASRARPTGQTLASPSINTTSYNQRGVHNVSSEEREAVEALLRMGSV